PQSQYDPSGNEALISFGLTETIRLAASRAAAEAGVALGLGCTANAAAGEPCTGSGYKLVAVHSLTPVEASGIGATATLQSTDEAVGSASLGDTQTGTVQKIKSGIKKATQGLTNKIINALVWKLAAKLGSTQKQDQLPAKKSFAAAGGFAFTYADHTVNVTLGPGAQLSSQGALVLDADASESAQVFAAAKISGTSSKPSEKRQASQHQTSISAALAIADDYNSATTDVGSDAVLNSPGVTAIDSGVSYPLLSTVSGLPTSVGELVGSLRSGKAVSSIENVIAYSTNAPLLLFANGLATAAAQASEVAFAASVTFLFLTGDAETDVATGTQINQSTAASPPAGQLVVIGAENSDALILLAGQVKSQSGSSATGMAPGDSAKGVGGSFAGLDLTNTTHAIVAPGVMIASGAQGGVYVQAHEYAMLFGLSQAGASADSTTISGTVTLLIQTSDTLAQVDTGAKITGGALDVYAGSLETALEAAGDVSRGHGTGIGVSVAIGIISRTTRAVLGSLDLSAPGAGGTKIAVSGPVTVSSLNDG
ncbi:MAG: hypothetical protein ACRDNS_02485, partial [Trebonia sp.]